MNPNRPGLDANIGAESALSVSTIYRDITMPTAMAESAFPTTLDTLTLDKLSYYIDCWHEQQRGRENIIFVHRHIYNWLMNPRKKHRGYKRKWARIAKDAAAEKSA